MRTETQWDLYVDESGKFNIPTDVVTVAGLLVDRTIAAFRPACLVETLRRISPSLPWPFHTAHQNLPIFHALAGSVGGTTESRFAARAWETLETATPGLAKAVRESFPIRTRRDYDQWRAANLALMAADRRLYSELQSEVARVRTAIKRVVANLGAKGSRPAEGAWLFVSSETRRGDSLPEDGSVGAVDQRFFTVLGCLLERVRSGLEHQGGKHHVFVHVLTRGVWDPFFGKRRELELRHLTAAIGPGALDSRASVRLVMGSTQAFRDGVHPVLMLSDFAANRSRIALRNASQSTARPQLPTTEKHLVDEVGLPCRSGSPELPHLSASGLAWDYLTAVAVRAAGEMGRLSAELEDPGVLAWAREQALEWAPHVGREAKP